MGNGMRVLERGFCPKFVQASLSRVHRVAPVGSTLSVPAGMSAHFTPMRAKALAGSFSEWHWGRGELAASSLDRCQPESAAARRIWLPLFPSVSQDIQERMLRRGRKGGSWLLVLRNLMPWLLGLPYGKNRNKEDIKIH